MLIGYKKHTAYTLKGDKCDSRPTDNYILYMALLLPI